MASSQSGIKAIDQTSVHRITSGQVVVDLQTAVKELVENSIDAKATNIEIRFKQYGLTSIEVIDNGHGIVENDFEGLGLKHHTSKLEVFEDLTTVQTFGFRGEALSSLCALCDEVKVTTSTEDTSPKGTCLSLNFNGEIESRQVVARKQGTTVFVSKLFAPLPVRRKEFERNVKREFNKCMTLLQAYALGPCSSKGIRLSVTNFSDKGQRSVQLQTQGTSLKATVASIWGPKAGDDLSELDISFEVEADQAVVKRLKAFNQPVPKAAQVKVKGLTSKFSVGSGRVNTDRQFLYLNGRPCNLPKLQKAFNDLYKTFNATQSPFLVADFIMPTQSCDVNVSPDKRTVLVHNEDSIVSAFKEQIELVFQPSRSTYDLGKPTTQGNLTQTLLTQRGSNAHATRAQTGPPSSKLKKGRGPELKAHSPSPSDSEATDNDEAGTEDEDEDEDEREGEGQDKDTNSQPPLAFRTISGRVPQSTMVRALPGATVPPRAQQPSPTSQVANPDENMSDEETPTVSMRGSLSPSDDKDPSTTDDPVGSMEIDTQETNSNPEDNPTSTFPVSKTAQVRPRPSSSQGDGDIIFDTRNMSWSQGRKAPPAEHIYPNSKENADPGLDDAWDADSERSRKRRRLNGVPDTSGENGLVAGIDEEGEAERPKSPINDPRPGQSNSVPTSFTPIAPTTASSKITGACRQPTKKPPRKGLALFDAFAAPGSQLPTAVVEHRDEVATLDELSDSSNSSGPALGRKPSPSPSISHLKDDQVPGADIDHPDVIDVDADEYSMDVYQGSEGFASICEDIASEVPPIGDAHTSSSSQSSFVDSSSARPEIIKHCDAENGVSINFDLNRVAKMWRQLSFKQTDVLPGTAESVPPGDQAIQISKDAGVSNAEDDAKASDALARVINKEDFASMLILGQFNLGFIIVRRNLGRGRDDLFIVDQHAADEKYNFETLQQTTKIHSQKLLRPRILELTAADELLATENMEVLHNNGFEVEVVGDAPDEGDIHSPSETGRLQLKAQPVSKSTVFDMKDLEEIIHLLRDSPSGKMVRCSKARAMFASRACRKSVMVGMPLNHSQMTSVVRHMGTMDQPWNCPHGRPTMRHLADIAEYGKKPSNDRSVNWSGFS